MSVKLYIIQNMTAKVQQQKPADNYLYVNLTLPLTRNNYKIPRIGIILEKSVLEAIY